MGTLELTPMQTALVVAVGLIAFYVAFRTRKRILKVFFWAVALLVAAWAAWRLFQG